MHLTISATEFKAKCLALLDQVNEGGTTLTVTKRGKAVAEVGAPKRMRGMKLEGAWAGWVDVPETVEGFDLTHLYQPDPLLTGRKARKR